MGNQLIGNDDEIAARLHALLTEYSGDRDRWSVDVSAGVAAITGTFADEAERRIVTALAHAARGVRRVDLHTRALA